MIHAEDTEADILVFSKAIVKKKLSNKSLDIQSEISEAIASKSDGQFLWAKLQSDSLRKGMNRKQLQRAVDNTPSGIESIYGRDWENIKHLSGKDKTRVVSILRWAAMAFRPLTVGELVEAVLVDLDCSDDPFDADELPDAVDQEYVDGEILGFCGSLIEIRPPSSSELEQPSSNADLSFSTVQLTHFSVREFLIPALRLEAFPGSIPVTTEETQAEAESAEDNTLAKICLHYIKFPRVWADQQVADTTTPVYTFRQYAARFWWQHYSHRKADEAARNLVEAFFQRGHPVWHTWARWYEITQFTDALLDEDGPSPGPLFFAAMWGWSDWVRRLLRDGHNVNERSRHGSTAASAVASNRNTDILGQLLEAGARVNNVDGMGETELHRSAWNGDLEIVRMLVAAGANVNSTAQRGRTPLHLAVESENVEVVKFLVDHGSDVHAKSSDEETALHAAAWTGRVDIMKTLNARGADIHARRSDGASLPHLAAGYGHAEAIQWLIDMGAEMNTRSETGLTPLHNAAVNGHAHVARLLLERGVPVRPKDEQTDSTPLKDAAANGHDEVVRLLLKYGADIEEANREGWRPLLCATRSGFPLVVNILIQAGADVNSTMGPTSRTPLSLAAHCNHVAVAKLLLDAGCDINTRDSKGLTALDYANDGSDEVAALIRSEMEKVGISEDHLSPS
jgi:ankyrin repeat protein